MFKSQMKFQKIICFVALIMTAILFVYSLGFITELYELFSPTIAVVNGKVVDLATKRNPLTNEIIEDYVKGNEFYFEIQTYVVSELQKNSQGIIQTVQVKHVGFNDNLVSGALIGIVIALLLFITSCTKRRNYYISNFVAIGATTAYNIGFAAWLIANLAKFEAKFKAVDHQALIDWFAREQFKEIDTNVSCFAIGYVLAALLIVVTGVLVFNLIWKLTLMKREHKLLQNNGVGEVPNA